MKTVNFYYTLDKTFGEGLDHRVCRRERDAGIDVSSYYNPHPTGIYLSWSFNGKYYKEAVLQKIKPAEWDWDKKLPIKKKHHELYILLQTIRTNIESEYLAMRTEGRTINGESIRGMVCRNIRGNYRENGVGNFWKVFDEFVEEKKPLSKPSTITKYKSLKKTLLAFEKAMNYPMSFETINARWYNQFMIYATSPSVAYMNNSIAKCIRMVKALMSYAYELKYHRSLDFKRFKAEEETTDPVFLTQEEIKMIEKCDTGKDTTLTYSKIIFLIGYFTGARISDLMAMKKKHLKILKDGSMEWELFQIKGRKVKSVQIYIVEPARKILEKYLIGKTEDDYVLPRISPVTINRRLKALGLYAGLNTLVTRVNYSGSNRIEVTREKWKCLTVHVARKSFITALCAGNIPDHEIMAASGHSSNRVLKVYKGIDRTRVADGMRRVFETNNQ